VKRVAGALAGATLAVALTAQSPAPTASAPPHSHDGSSLRNAIVLHARNEDEGVRSEYEYVAALTCNGGGHWKVTRQALVSAGGRSYDILSATCSDGGAERSFFFDITGFFGKL